MALDAIPEELSAFMARHFGASGPEWLARLPDLIEACAALCDLEIEHHIAGGFSCVLAAHTSVGEPIVGPPKDGRQLG